jgi:hypothetical protein
VRGKCSLAVLGKGPQWPLPANAGRSESTWATPKKPRFLGVTNRRILRRQAFFAACSGGLWTRETPSEFFSACWLADVFIHSRVLQRAPAELFHGLLDSQRAVANRLPSSLLETVHGHRINHPFRSHPGPPAPAAGLSLTGRAARKPLLVSKPKWLMGTSGTMVRRLRPRLRT